MGGIMIIVKENRIGKPSSNSKQSGGFTNTFGEGLDPSLLAMSKLLGTRFWLLEQLLNLNQYQPCSGLEW